ncbi:hypothetical protein FJ936_13455 [Mesorhizobium sp. B2-4-13]|uniref:hypothetical protein n=1 Tax=Mesorhizobium sp. B2-4-13 TaxID=2589936 RepID=UPI00115420B2|nr:hypothetical protein [Mesorhizobium sp. B2-4-13]TPK84879.1 hypothetical protein FJ936_13455 [Mesorhizobium sp. B2-4-13]
MTLVTKIGILLGMCVVIGIADEAKAVAGKLKGDEIRILLISHKMQVTGNFFGNRFSGELQWFTSGKFRVVEGMYVDRSGKRTPAVNAGVRGI